MENEDVRKVVCVRIKGRVPDDVQGVNLREDIEKKAKELNSDKKYDIRGYVRNVKGKAEVEVLFYAKKEEGEEEFIDEIEKLVSGLAANTEGPWEEKRSVKFEDFKAVREDELTEMVWALRGAGKVFSGLVKEVRNQTQAMWGQEMERERKMLESLVRSIESELVSINERRAYIEEGERHLGFRLFCIENFIKEPPSDVDKDFLRSLNELYELCDEVNQLIKMKVIDQNKLRDNLKGIENLINSLSVHIEDCKKKKNLS